MKKDLNEFINYEYKTYTDNLNEGLYTEDGI